MGFLTKIHYTYFKSGFIYNMIVAMLNHFESMYINSGVRANIYPLSSISEENRVLAGQNKF
jgi:hypothetical protein